MIKILSVDDELDLELLLTQYFRRKIRKGEYEFYFAHNGVEAMQSLTLLKKIKDRNNPALKVVMVSAYGEMSNIRQAMNNGAFDFATKPIDLELLLTQYFRRKIRKGEYEFYFAHNGVEAMQRYLCYDKAGKGRWRRLLRLLPYRR